MVYLVLFLTSHWNKIRPAKLDSVDRPRDKTNQIQRHFDIWHPASHNMRISRSIRTASVSRCYHITQLSKQNSITVGKMHRRCLSYFQAGRAIFFASEPVKHALNTCASKFLGEQFWHISCTKWLHFVIFFIQFFFLCSFILFFEICAQSNENSASEKEHLMISIYCWQIIFILKENHIKRSRYQRGNWVSNKHP